LESPSFWTAEKKWQAAQFDSGCHETSSIVYDSDLLHDQFIVNDDKLKSNRLISLRLAEAVAAKVEDGKHSRCCSTVDVRRQACRHVNRDADQVA
jgi:hypothetical protein